MNEKNVTLQKIRLVHPSFQLIYEDKTKTSEKIVKPSRLYLQYDDEDHCKGRVMTTNREMLPLAWNPTSTASIFETTFVLLRTSEVGLRAGKVGSERSTAGLLDRRGARAQ